MTTEGPGDDTDLYNRVIYSYKFRSLHLRIHCLDQSDTILTF